MYRTDSQLPEASGEKGEEIKKNTLAVTDQSQGCTYGTGNPVNDVTTTMHSARWGVPEILGWGALCKGYDCLPTMLYT